MVSTPFFVFLEVEMKLGPKLALNVLLAALALAGANAALAFVALDGGDCVPNQFLIPAGINTCASQNFFARRTGGLSVLPVFSADGTRVSGTLDDERFAFTTGSTAFIRGSADLATGQLRAQANSIEGTSVLESAIRVDFGDTVTLHGSSDADGIFDGLYTFTMGLTVHGNRATDFTNSQSFIRQSLVEITGRRADSPFDSSRGCDNFLLSRDIFAGDGDLIDMTVAVTCTLPSIFLFSAELSSGRVNDGFFDAGNTAQFFFDFPSGVTFTSESGVLLSSVSDGTPSDGTPSGVGEPPVIPLVLLGGIAMFLSRRHG